MPAPSYSAQDFLGALQSLLPRGRAWPRDPQATQTKVLAGLTQSYALQTARSNNLLVDAFPLTTTELLPEWESTLGLPLVAAGPSPSILARRLLVVARFVGPGGMSIGALTNYSSMLGFQVTVTASAPFRCGQSGCGQTVGKIEQMFGLAFTVAGSASTPFGIYGPAVIANEINRIIPPFSSSIFIFN